MHAAKSWFIAYVSTLLVLALALGGAARGAEEAGYIIAHPGVNIVSEDVRDLYTGEKQFAGSIRLVPLDNAAFQATFLARFLGISEARYANLWTRKAFRDALNPPEIANNDREVINLVRKTPGAVGYINGAPPQAAGVQIVHKF